jgi:hypothetical protein
VFRWRWATKAASDRREPPVEVDGEANSDPNSGKKAGAAHGAPPFRVRPILPPPGV